MINVPIIHIAIPLIYVQIILLILLSIASIIFLFVVGVLLLDGIYRREASQYPKHFLWDTLAPIIMLILPSILVLTIANEKISLIEKFLFIICIHGFILIPLMNTWSKNRKWPLMTDLSMNNPRIYLRLSIALMYPALFGIYYTSLRYLRLGHCINIYDLIKELSLLSYIPYVVLGILTWPFISIWIRLIFWKLLDLRLWLWEEFISLITFLHISLLKYNLYFKIMEILYKLSYIWISYFIYDSYIYKKWPQSHFRWVMYKIYSFPILYFVLLAIICFVELIYFNGTLYYTLYVILISLMLRPIAYFLSHFNGPENTWIQSCCYSDYLENRWDKPRYPDKFWLSFNDLRQHFKNQPDISNNFEYQIRKIISHFQKKVKKNRLLIINRAYKLSSRSQTRRIHLLKTGYHQWTQVRWVHTTTTNIIVPATKKIWHPFTSFFARNVYDLGALLNNDWSHYQTIQQVERKYRFVTPENLYRNFPTKMPSNKGSNIAQLTEQNVLTNFSESVKEGVKVNTYHKTIVANTFSQSQYDMSYDMKKANFTDKRIHGMDQKSSQNPREVNSNMLSGVSIDQYDTILTNFYRSLKTQYASSYSMDQFHILQVGLNSLKDTSEDFGKHQLAWASILHHFPNNSIPPLRLPHNFALRDLTRESLDLLRKSEIRMEKISNLLHVRKVSTKDYKQAIALFEDTEIQRILAGNEI